MCFKDIFKKITLFVLILLFPFYLECYFYDLQEWSNGKQILFLFSDKHVDTKKALSQRIDLISAAKQMNAFVIVEDKLDIAILNLDSNIWNKIPLYEEYEEIKKSPLILFFNAIHKACYVRIMSGLRIKSSYDPNADYSAFLPSNFLEIANQCFTPLVGLTQFCRQHGISTKNIEFRFYEVLEDLLEGHARAMSELRSYHDCSILDSFYDEILQCPLYLEVNKLLSYFIEKYPYTRSEDFIGNDFFYDSLFDKLACDISDWVLFTGMQYSSSKKAIKNRIILAFNSSLIEARILHEVYCHMQYVNIFICAGGEHIVNICKTLSKLGFRFIRIAEATFDPEIISAGSDLDRVVVNIKRYFEEFHK